ncbi:cytochrome b/b6 domain-containing protein [Alteromonas halophila]|uniref:Cytochrome b561 n=1 Tax=Alteromonas halophila TaxID=516698 RepID=A0A918JDZ1_9ALTE|nr:cytochrome b/b6 domain-containing protein [Alteromonas halophila]GGW75696.1 cytochrome b561 [Alteromonas halophila]
MTKKLIWDMPTRLFHWLLVAGIVAQYVTAEVLDNAMQWHFYCGYFVLGLVLFRLIWGVFGTRYARFTQFVAGPSRVVAYVKTLTDKQSVDHAGHNPLGGWAVILMLLLVGTQAVSGLFLTDDVFLDGPYRHLVSETVQDLANTIHHTGFNVLLAVIALHIVAIAFYSLYKHHHLVPAMFHGKKDSQSPGIASSKLLLAFIVAAVCAVLVYYAVFIAPPQPATEGLYY